ncbi:uncharacterized protein LOC142235976 [Haematobia irritans]|uniref:uncharacterized protein LOC142235976 n=1 Tax=Haematobia irritans TaxID=7368 RepID=UPI003F4FAC1A
MHSGPDLLKPLVNVLLNFRVGKVAVCGDIAEMFHQIKVRESDMHTQRFLWWDKNDLPEKPSVYVMCSLTFGISCAPCIAHYVRDFNADQFKDKYTCAVTAIQHNHYVDDFIDSVDSEEEAIELASQLKLIHAADGFHIRNWSSNNDAVTNYLEEITSSEKTPKGLTNTEKMLGMYWDPNKDVFVYIFRFATLRRDILTAEIIPTKRELLQALMSIFDPLGFISCYTTTLKILLQEVWRSDINWDDEIRNCLYIKWQNWKAAIDRISAVEIPRCYSQYLNEATEIELHTFVDAGEDAYAAVCYSRVFSQHQCEILEVTNVTQWRKYQHNWNVSMWFTGPQFLRESKSTWPECVKLDVCGHEEIRHNFLHIHKDKAATLNVEYFSNWRRLYRALATFILYVKRLKMRRKGDNLPNQVSYDMVHQAKSTLFKYAQQTEFREEIHCLKNDDGGVLRAKGRTSFLNP